MKDLIEAFTIFAQYTDARCPTHCEHDVLYVLVSPAAVTTEHASRLEALGFTPDESENHFYSFRFGSA